MRALTPAELLQKIDHARDLWEKYRKAHTEAAPYARREREAYLAAKQALEQLETVIRGQVAPVIEPFTHLDDGPLDAPEGPRAE